ncbi:uncharacterized protein LOC119681065 [Teleopsis dalmanni]|uniref:uncharacterized protein LOC119681065 n=1 Tax=Teleopsis dalmanni TaxID=139649 RepID=UPI0018CDCF31|nr:uncharacterized protein LOC119681065 [Teleopsis dalmanni]
MSSAENEEIDPETRFADTPFGAYYNNVIKNVERPMLLNCVTPSTLPGMFNVYIYRKDEQSITLLGDYIANLNEYRLFTYTATFYEVHKMVLRQYETKQRVEELFMLSYNQQEH